MNIRLHTMPLLLGAAFFTLVFSGCKVYQDVTLTEVNNVKITEFGAEGIKADITVSMSNPNWYKLKITDSEIDLYFEGQKVAQVKITDELVIPKKQVSAQTFTIHSTSADLSGVLSNALTLFFKSEFLLEGKGYIDGKAMFVARKVPIEFKQKLSKEDLGF
jgi:LEA14-like dessication related protein